MRTVLFLAVLSAGCVAGLDDVDSIDETSEGDPSARVALNGLTANTSMSLTTTTRPLQILAQGSLASAGVRVPALFSTEAGREQFAYLYSCADSASKSLTVTANGVSYTFTGGLGLAPEWTTTSLVPYKYKMMTACMLARTNYAGVNVEISMRGSTLSTRPAELTNFTVVEGAFWGDAFSPGGTVHACPSPEKLKRRQVSTLPQRECTVSVDGITTKCGFAYAGPCEDVCVTNQTNAIAYSNCEGNADTIVVYVAAP